MPSPANDSFLICSSLLRQDGLDSLNASNLPFPPTGLRAALPAERDAPGEDGGYVKESVFLRSFSFPFFFLSVGSGSAVGVGSVRYRKYVQFLSWPSVNGPMGKGMMCFAEAEIILVTRGRPPR